MSLILIDALLAGHLYELYPVSNRTRAVWQYLGVKGPWKKPLRGKVQERDFPTPLGNPATSARFPLFPPPRRRRLSFFDFSGKKNS
jgi:hypothetical protein